MSRKGNKSFDRCGNKVIEFKDFVFPPEVNGNDIVTDRYVNLKSGKTANRICVSVTETQDGYDAGHQAILHCPRTEDQRVEIASATDNHASRIGAYNSVRDLAGTLLCEHCKYSDMNPIDVTIERAKIARAEAERLEALSLRATALQELLQVDPNYITPRSISE